jgi:hypothetical protein
LAEQVCGAIPVICIFKIDRLSARFSASINFATVAIVLSWSSSTKQSLKTHYSEEQLKSFVNFCLHYIADLDIPVKRFVESALISR